MKKKIIFYIIILSAITSAYSKRLAIIPDIGKPSWIRVDSGYIFISDHYSVLIYELKSLKLITTIGREGEGPEEFKTKPRISFSNRGIIIYDLYKITMYSKQLKYLSERKSDIALYHLEMLKNGFVIETLTSHMDRFKQLKDFSLYNNKIEKTEGILQIPRDKKYYNLLIFPYPVLRTWKDLIFISQPNKGFYIDIFDNYGKKLYKIEKKIKKIKFEEKHRRYVMNRNLFVVGRKRFEKSKKKGIFNKPTTKFLPDINNFWVKDDKIYIKTYDITDKTEKFIILDIKGNPIKTIFLPMTYIEILAFDNNIFYYFEDNNVGEWILNSIEL